MVHPDTYLKITSKGLGLFAKRRFERGTILWIADDVDPKMTLDTYLLLDELQRQKLDIYSYIDYEGRVVIQRDEGRYIDHSCMPNITGILGFDNLSIALRTIEPDEEILEDYYNYYGHFETFDCHCGTPNCQGTVSANSYRADLRLSLDEVRPLILSLPQCLLQVHPQKTRCFISGSTSTWSTPNSNKKPSWPQPCTHWLRNRRAQSAGLPRLGRNRNRIEGYAASTPPDQKRRSEGDQRNQLRQHPPDVYADGRYHYQYRRRNRHLRIRCHATDTRYYAPLRDIVLPETMRFVAGFVHEKHTLAENRHMLGSIETARGQLVDVACS